MGCIGAIIGSIFSFFYYIIVVSIRIIGYLIMFLIAGIISITKHIIKSRKEKKSHNYNATNYYQNNTPTAKSTKSKPNSQKENNIKYKINNTQNITNSYSYLKIYINKKHKGLRKNNELNYELLNIKSYDAPTVYYDDLAEIKDYNVFEADECSSEKYGDLLQKIHKHCGNDFYATIGYEYDKVEYRITIKDNNIYINGNNVQYMKNRYICLKNKIIAFSDDLFERLMYIDNDNFYYEVIPNDDLDCDSITALSDKLKESTETLMFEIPYMEEISYIIDIIEPKIIKESNKGLEKTMNSLPDIEIVEPDEPYEEPTINENKPKEKSWEEQQFDEEAELWGLSEEDKRIAREERMTPAEFVEAEEYDDDELLLDEWER